ncbi:MAG TPA: LysM peptidoglycan-binding domain-containing protein [bacterium]|nr:LysM peptidoglycan-binding domain-containing protein [bacterium]HQB26244.1 LysM peptidoglycan-binding domain-containing protein [bacterium]
MKKILFLVALLGAICLNGGTVYTVKLGDTLEGIAQAYGVTLADLAEVNYIDPPYIIWVGMELKIPETRQQPQLKAVDTGRATGLLPRAMGQNPTQRHQVFVWDKKPFAAGGVGRFSNKSADGYYRYANVKWQPISLSGPFSFGAWGEVGDDFCQAKQGDWSQSALSSKGGLVLDYYNPADWFDCWSLKGYYGFRHAEAQDGSWSQTQEDQTWAVNWWVRVHQDNLVHWFGRTSVTAEYVGLVDTKAVGGVAGQHAPLPSCSPVKWEGSMEQSLYSWQSGGINCTVGYRHLDGEMDTGKDRGFGGINVQLGWAKVLYELEVGEKIQNKIEAQLSF